MNALSTLLASTFGIFIIGVALRVTRAVPDTTPQVLNRVVMHATMPALSLTVLVRAELSWDVASAIFATTVALAAALGCSWAVTRLLRLSRPATGAVLLTGTFANTGFLGIPVVLAVFAHEPTAGATAVLINIVDATLLLWTLGVVIGARHQGEPGARHQTGARHQVSGPLSVRSVVATLLSQPLLWAVLLGLGLNLLRLSLPAWLQAPLTLLGQATAPLVFLSLGLGLSLVGLRAQILAIGGATLAKLLVAPTVAWAVGWALSLDPVTLRVAVLQAAMPTALVSAIIAREQGCDAGLATAIAATTTSLAIVTLPLVIAALV